MRFVWFLAFVVSFVFLVFPAAAQAQGSEQLLEKRLQMREKMVQRDCSCELVVRWKDVVPAGEKAMLLQKFGLQNLHEHKGLSLIDTRGQEQQAIIDKLKRSGRVEFVEPNMPVKLCSVPNDPLFPDQWWLHKINAAGAWERLVSDREPVTVAVIDTGVDFYHEDLAGRIDCDRAWDFVFDDDFPYDLDGHGTLVAGVLAGATDNHIGIAGASGDPAESDLYITPDQLLQIVFNQRVGLDRNTVSFFHLIDAGGREIPAHLYFVGEVPPSGCSRWKPGSQEQHISCR